MAGCASTLIRPRRWRLVVLAALALGASSAVPARAQPVLYRAQAYTTGTDARDRDAALGRCLRDVMVQVSGNPDLADDPRLDGIEAGPSVASYVYLDRMTDVPHHDEQGSRDRPYDLVVEFDPARVDAALAGLGEKPWPAADRPPLLVRIAMVKDGETAPLTADGVFDERPRRALLAAAERYGLRVVLPPGPRPGALPVRQDGVALSGTLDWTPQAFGWTGQWSLAWQGRDHAWRIQGVSYDEAFRSAVRGALRILSGHGDPG